MLQYLKAFTDSADVTSVAGALLALSGLVFILYVATILLLVGWHKGHSR